MWTFRCEGPMGKPVANPKDPILFMRRLRSGWVGKNEEVEQEIVGIGGNIDDRIDDH